MEAPISSSLGAMGVLLGKLDELLRTAHRALSIQQLRNDLGVINTRLVELSKLNAPSLTAKYWMKDVRELSYDMDDCVDQFVHADADAKMDWIEKISGFKTRVEEANERHDRYKLDYVLSSANTAVDHRLPTVDAKAAIDPVGIDGPMSELDRWLTDGEQQLRAASIVGVGGVGKSTLAQKIFCKHGEQFECRAFVQMAKTPDVRRILRSMLLQVRKHQPPESCEVHNLIHDLRKHLQDKRYFIIVDDLWATSAWDIVSRAFPEGNHGSRIVTTTKFEDVALACCGYKSKYILKMKPLSDDDSKKIFISVVFGSGKGCPQQFSDVSYEITRKCGGLPLALVSIANLLASQPETIEHWEYVQNFMSNNLRTNPTFDEILKQVLDLCYNSLSHCLKTCLLYLGVYPENYTIRKEDLVKQWVAEGFICATKGEDIMEVAGSYFDKLVNLGLIQCIYINNNDKVLSYAVHHMVLDLITYKSIEENFTTIMDYSQTTVGLSDKVRRLSLHFGSATYATTPAGIGLSQVRSLVFVGLFNRMPSIVEFKLLRVMILHFLDDNGNKSFNLRGIRKLFRLTYLQITCNVTVKLPHQIKWLKHLETLEINARAVAVPSDIVHLSSLLHLRLRSERNLPGMIGNRKSVTLDPGASGTTISLDDTAIVPSSPVFLQTFELLPPICIFSRLPKWMGQLRKLCILKIVVKELLSDDIDILAGLPELTVLSVYVRQPTAERIVFNRGTFPLLKCSKFWCGVLCLVFQEEAMPNLRRLKLGFNAHRGELYGNMLAGIEHLLNLQEIDGRIGAAAGAEESDWRAAESAFKNAVCKHSRLTNFDIRRVDWVDEEVPQFSDLPASSSHPLKPDSPPNTKSESCASSVANPQIWDLATSSSHLLKPDSFPKLQSESCTSGVDESQKYKRNAKYCLYPGCMKEVRGASGHCIAHGGGRRCQKPGCHKGAEGRTVYCKAHGGGRRCQHLGCTKSAEGRTDFCIAHGGGRCCSHEGCSRAARGKSGLCIRHGGGKRCQHLGCTKSAEGRTDLCIAHGGGRRCSHEGCSRAARGKSGLCISHGGGKRCKSTGCMKSSQGSTDFCKAHGGGKRCSWGLAGLSSGVGEPQCDKFARSDTGLCSAHSALVQDYRGQGGDTLGSVIDQSATDVKLDEMKVAAVKGDSHMKTSSDDKAHCGG